MPNRILKESICTSDNLNKLTPQEEVFFYRLMVNCDDYGIADARVKILRSKCFPLKDSIRDSDIEKWLKKLIQANLIFIYEVDGKRYLKLTSWDRHQQVRAKKSKFPTPDSNGYQLISNDCICPRNPIQSESESNPNSDVAKIFDAWNKQEIIQHKELTPDIVNVLNKVLRKHSADEIETAIQRYAKMLKDQSYQFCQYKWTLINFLSREKGYTYFLDNGEKWINYKATTGKGKSTDISWKDNPLAGTLVYYDRDAPPPPPPLRVVPDDDDIPY